MPAYFVFIRDEPLRDQAEMAEYQRKNAEGRKNGAPSFGMKPLAFYGKTIGVEGPTPDGVVLLEFPSVEEAQAWYDSPAYQEALPHRMNAADYRVFLIEGA